MKVLWRLVSSVLLILLVFMVVPLLYTILALIPSLGAYLQENPALLQHFTMIMVSIILISLIGKGNREMFGFTLSWKFPLFGVVGFSIVLGSLTSLVAILLDLSTFNMPVEGMSMLQKIFYVWILASIAEETLFRGLIQGYLAPLKTIHLKIGRLVLTLPVIVAALLFALLHLMLLTMGVDPVAVLIIVIAGFILGLAAGYYKEATGSLLPAIIIHTCFNIGGSIPGFFC